MARKKKGFETRHLPPWFATYADMITLLMCFFVLLFAFSTIDAEKWKSVVTGLTGNPSIFDGLDYSANPIAEGLFPGADLDEVDLQNLIQSSDSWEEFIDALQEALAMANADGTSVAQMQSSATEIVINLSGDVLFDSGSDHLKAENLDVLVDVLKQIEKNLPIVGFISIEGHTDSVPINTPRFPSNWELSQGRSASVLRYLLPMIDDSEIPRRLFNIGGYGEERPIDTNDTSDGRQNNRRVTFRIIKSDIPLPDAPKTVSPADIP